MEILHHYIAFVIILRSALCSKRIVALERISHLKSLGEKTVQTWRFLANSRDVCTGVLMSPTEVLTTCECVLDNNNDNFLLRLKREVDHNLRLINPKELRVRVKDIAPRDADHLNVTEIQIHPKCDAEGSYDLAMLRLSSPVENCSNWFTNFPFGSDWNGSWEDGDSEDVEMPNEKSLCYLASHLSNAMVWSHPLWTKRIHNGITAIPVDIVDMKYCDRFLRLGREPLNFDKTTKICVEAEQKPLPICKADIGSPLICTVVGDVKSTRLIGITTVGNVECNAKVHDALAIVTPLDDESWHFIYDFMGIGYKHWALCILKRFLRLLKKCLTIFMPSI